MKNAFHLILALSLLLPAGAWAKPKPAASPSPTASPSASPSPAPTVTLNPDTLVPLVLSGNLSILSEINQLQQAQTSVNIDRGKLLPSLNISLSTVESFGLSEIAFLVPFLVPDNWFALKASEYELTADEDSYFILELNTYASALALYETLAADIQQRDIYEQQYQNYTTLVSALEDENALGGSVDSTDLQSAQAQAADAFVTVTNWDKSISQAEDQLQVAMDLPVGTTFVVQQVNLAPVPQESGVPVDTVAAQAVSLAPELAQEAALVSAATDSKWSSVFSFIGSNTVSSQGGNGNQSGSSGSNGLSGLADVGSFNFGFAQFPEITLSKEQIAALQIQVSLTTLQEGEVVESAIQSIQDDNAAYASAVNAAELQQEVYLTEIKKYDLGQSTLDNIIVDQTSVTNFGLDVAQAQLDLNLQRINLNRALLADRFAQIKGCDLQPSAQKKGGSWLSDLFHPSAGEMTLDQMCHAPSPSSSQ